MKHTTIQFGTIAIHCGTFAGVLPGVPSDALSRLEDECVRDGILEPLRYWVDPADETAHLVDGHHRYAIAMRRSLDMTWQPLFGCEDRDEVREWMLLHQLGRRNLSPDVASLLRGKLCRAMAAKAPRKDPDGRYAPRYQNDTAVKTSEKSTSRAREQVAQATGVSPATVARDAEFAKRVEEKKAGDPKIENKIAAGEVRRRDVMKPAPPVAPPASPATPGWESLAEQIREKVKEMRACAKSVESLMTQPLYERVGGIQHWQPAGDQYQCRTLRAIAKELAAASPAGPCPACHGVGKGCTLRDRRSGQVTRPCHESGWMTADELKRFDACYYVETSGGGRVK